MNIDAKPLSITLASRKLVLFAGDMILCREIIKPFKNRSEKLLELIKEFNSYRILHQHKYQLSLNATIEMNCYNFIVMSNLRKTIPFVRASKPVLKNVFNQEVLDLHFVNDRLFLKDTTEVINK